MSTMHVAFPQEFLGTFCVRKHICKLSLFGSVLTPRFRPESDVDVLVEFDPLQIPSYFELIGMEMELSEALGRKVEGYGGPPRGLRADFSLMSIAAGGPTSRPENPRVGRPIYPSRTPVAIRNAADMLFEKWTA